MDMRHPRGTRTSAMPEIIKIIPQKEAIKILDI
jgi:hypothetical protein